MEATCPDRWRYLAFELSSSSIADMVKNRADLCECIRLELVLDTSKKTTQISGFVQPQRYVRILSPRS